MHLTPPRFFLGKRLSANFPISDLTSIQRCSYCNLFSKEGADILSGRSIRESIHAVDTKGSMIDKALSSAFPITDSFGKVLLEYVSYSIRKPKISAEDAIEQSMSYTSPLYAKFRMVVFDVNADTGASEIVSVKEQDVHLFDLPIMSDDSCSFVLNGVERVVLSQIHRSPGVFFDCDQHSSVNSYSARIIPHKGSWIDFEFTANGAMAVRINKRRKLPIAVFLSAMGFTPDEVVLELCSTVDVAPSKIKGFGLISFNEKYEQKRFSSPYNLYDENGGQVIKSGATIRGELLGEDLYVKYEDLSDSIFARSISINKDLSISAGSKVSSETLKIVLNEGSSITIVNLSSAGNPIFAIQKGFNEYFASRSESIKMVLKSFLISTPSEDSELALAFEKLLFNSAYFSLSDIGRYKINRDLGLNVDSEVTHLTKDDILGILKSLLHSRQKGKRFSDTDSLANRRIRSVGELIKNQLDSSLIKVVRLASEKLNLSSATSLLPSDIIPVNIIVSDVKEFLLLSKLSQFVDQVNPLADLVHKRRITALGTGGLSRERAGFEVRDVHYSHYGRICPIETPEGQNIGLINSPACYAKLDKYGFIISPYRRVKNRKILNEVAYLESDEEKSCVIAQIEKSLIDNSGYLAEGLVNCRYDGEFIMKDSSEVEYIEVSPKQILSISSALIPFVDHNDASRALMGANMQRQAVPLMFPQSPLVGTGIEKEIVDNVSFSVRARRPGVVSAIFNDSIIISVEDEKRPFDTYYIRKFSKTNHGTSFNNKILVSIGDKISVGAILADGSSTDRGEMAIGKDLLVAFMPWNGYNFEDAIVISEKIAKSQTYSSVHIEELEVLIKDTKLGPEEITRHVPNIPAHLLSKLDESGIVEIGSCVSHDDVLVGKVTPKVEDVLMPEEKLLKAIFGDKNSNLKNSSLIVPPGVSGVVIDVKIFVRSGVQKNERARSIEYFQLMRSKQGYEARHAIIQEYFSKKADELLQAAGNLVHLGKKITPDEAVKLDLEGKFSISSDKSAEASLRSMKEAYNHSIDLIQGDYQERANNIVNGTGISNQKSLASVKVYIATEIRLQPGDKMAGRHGNKGVISTVLPVEDMPFLEDGTPVDIVLNPLGVSSRMNIGQILETHVGLIVNRLGKRAHEMYEDGATREEIQNLILSVLFTMRSDEKERLKALSDDEFFALVEGSKGGFRVAIPPFEGISSDEIGRMLERLGLDGSGQFRLYDGTTGEAFENKVTVGYMHFLKLHHLVEDKVHARSVGPYSLVTQQPLGGRMHFGGQRVGEMECWALQAYGVAYTLQEIITVKSDDINGRIAVYESIVKGNDAYFPGMPESFNVMMKELRSLCLNVELESVADSRSLL